MAQKHDWDRIEHEYVTGKMSQEALARKHGIGLSTFYTMSSRRNFSEKRRAYQESVKEKALARAQARDARTLSNVRSALDKAARTINRYITDEDTLHGRVVMGEGGPAEYRVKKLDTKALRDMTAALRETAAAIQALAPAEQNGTGQRSGVIILPEVNDG
jgi:hypothetical protein